MLSRCFKLKQFYDTMSHMMTDGRSTRRQPQRQTHQVTTTDPQRRALWLRLFGVDVLPVKRPFPELFIDAAGNERLAYVLDSRQLTAIQINKLASYLQARIWGLGYQDAQRQARERWTIDAEGVELVDPEDETAVSDRERPFFVAGSQAGLFMAAS